MNATYEERLRERMAALTVSPTHDVAARAVGKARRRRLTHLVVAVLALVGVAALALTLWRPPVFWAVPEPDPLGTRSGPPPTTSAPVATPTSSPSRVPGSPTVSSPVPSASGPATAAAALRLDGVGRLTLGMSVAQAQRAGLLVDHPDFQCGTVMTATFERQYPGVYPDWGQRGPLRGILVKDVDRYRTDRGIGIGSTLAQVRAAYGAELSELPRTTTYFDDISNEAAGAWLGSKVRVITNGKRYLALLIPASGDGAGTVTGLWIGGINAMGQLVTVKGC